MLPQSLRRRRLLLEFKLMLENAPTFACVDKQLTRYLGVIAGCGLYEGGYFVVEFILPSAYPYYPPLVLWYTPIWHPNISYPPKLRIGSPRGSFEIFGPCLFVEHFKNYAPSHHVFGLVEFIRTYLTEPDPSSPLNLDAAMQLQRDPEEFRRNVESYLEKYAGFDKSASLLEEILRCNLSRKLFKEMQEQTFKDLCEPDKSLDEISWIKSTMTLINNLIHRKSIELARKLPLESKQQRRLTKRAERRPLHSTGLTCPVCSIEIFEGDKVFKCPYCGVVTHYKCVQPWIESRRTCPICRGALSRFVDQEYMVGRP